MATPQQIIAPKGPEIVIADKWMPAPVEQVLKRYNPRSNTGQAVRTIMAHLPDTAEVRAAAHELIERLCASVVIESRLHLTVFRGPLSLKSFDNLYPVEDCGWVGWKVVTTAGVNFIVDAFQNSVEVENMKFHGLGTGSTAEAVGDTALVTELTTEYTGDVRATGSLTEGASANIFRTVGTNTMDEAPGAALREHGIFSASSGGTLLDRTVFAAVTLGSGDSLQSTYDFTITAGS